MVECFLIGIGLLLIGIGLLKMFYHPYDGNFAEFIGMFLIGLSFFWLLIVSIGSGIAYKEAKFINENFGTSYTTEEMFWHGSDIKKMVIGEKRRVENE
jgi:hypothetical protein